MSITVWYHDPAEVDVKTSWTGLTPALRGAAYHDIRSCKVPRLQALYAYARPDAVISVNGIPVVSIEQTAMNPSGHNMPQRFSCLAIAAEQGVAGIIYHPEKSRRTFSDPNLRYANPRVAMAQFHMNTLFPASPPSLSVYWPTDPATLLPATTQGAQSNLAAVVEDLLVHRPTAANASSLSSISGALREMRRVVDEYGERIRANASFRKAFPKAEPIWLTTSGGRVDPPPKAVFLRTSALMAQITQRYRFSSAGLGSLPSLLPRQHCLHFAATTNAAGTDSEHPWPGYFSLLDMLYARTGPDKSKRRVSMVFELPVPTRTYLQRLNTGLVFPRIIDGVADIVLLRDGVVTGGVANGGTGLLTT